MLRVSCVTKRPVGGEESYRVLIDQLPASHQKRTSAVNCWYAIPFPSSRCIRTPRSGRGMDGGGQRQQGQGHRTQRRRSTPAHRRAQPPQQQGKDRLVQQGVVGYVLGKSTVAWTAPAAGFAPDGSVSISAQSDTDRSKR
jgi:fimbrial chaperone protein